MSENLSAGSGSLSRWCWCSLISLVCGGAPRRDVARMQVNPPPELLCPRAQCLQPTLGRALPGHGAGSSIGHPEPADEQLSRIPCCCCCCWLRSDQDEEAQGEGELLSGRMSGDGKHFQLQNLDRGWFIAWIYGKWQGGVWSGGWCRQVRIRGCLPAKGRSPPWPWTSLIYTHTPDNYHVGKEGLRSIETRPACDDRFCSQTEIDWSLRSELFTSLCASIYPASCFWVILHFLNGHKSLPLYTLRCFLKFHLFWNTFNNVLKVIRRYTQHCAIHIRVRPSQILQLTYAVWVGEPD